MFLSVELLKIESKQNVKRKSRQKTRVELYLYKIEDNKIKGFIERQHVSVFKEGS